MWQTNGIQCVRNVFLAGWASFCTSNATKAKTYAFYKPDSKDRHNFVQKVKTDFHIKIRQIVYSEKFDTFFMENAAANEEYNQAIYNPINSTPQPFPNKTKQYLHILLACILKLHGHVGGHLNLADSVLYKGCPLRACITHCPCRMLGLQSFLHSYPLHTLYLHLG